jgi:hypothetical protein
VYGAHARGLQTLKALFTIKTYCKANGKYAIGEADEKFSDHCSKTS